MNKQKNNFNYFSLLKDIDNNIIKPIYFIYGEEIYLHRAIEDKIKEYFSHQELKVNYETFYGENLDYYNLAASIQTLPLGNNKQCVIIKQFEKIKEPFAEKINILISKLSFKNNDLQLLLFSQDKKIPKNIIIKNIEKYGVLVSTPRLKIKEIQQWIRKRIKVENKKIDEEAIIHLMRAAENDFTQINNEIDKLICFLGESNENITKKMILENTYGFQEGNIFDFVDKVGEKKTGEALLLLKLLLDSNHYHPLQVHAMLTRQFRMILEMKLSINDKKNKGGLNLPYFLIEKIIQQSQKYKVDEIKRAFHYLLKAESDIKTGNSFPAIVLEQLVQQITE